MHMIFYKPTKRRKNNRFIMAKRERLFDTFKKTTSTFKLMMPSTDVLVIQESKSNLILSLHSCYIRPERNFENSFGAEILSGSVEEFPVSPTKFWEGVSINRT
ncbi:hypothetical protein AVEN_94993-1 [Araneus ventricosus]|uniref:Uncharacterized protein n=1 Tax=Araneus ventricosus TaxID=182803 RepID=A0A4Y2NXR6_ARAVE|nr:hypothetical protein AVEN_94993-1 [Araneus ventricosus]